MQLNGDMAYFLGALRDGYIDRKQYLISVSQKDVRWLEYLQQIVNENFKCRSKIRKFQDEYFELRIFSKNTFELLRNELTDICKIPPRIRDNVQLWKPYIEGFFDAEGYCTSPETFRKTGKKKISFHQNDLESLEFISGILNQLKIRNSIYLQKGRKCYALYIQSSGGIRRFAEEFKPYMKSQRINILLSVLPL